MTPKEEALLRADVAWLEGRGKRWLGRSNVLGLLATLDAERKRPETVAEEVRYADGNGTSEYWRGFNDGIDAFLARLASPGEAK